MCADFTLQSSTCVCQFASVCFVCQASHIKICVLNFTKQWMCVFVCYMQCACFVCQASHTKICVLNFTKQCLCMFVCQYVLCVSSFTHQNMCAQLHKDDCVLIVSSFRDQKNVCSTSQSSTCVYQCVLQMSSFTHETFCA